MYTQIRFEESETYVRGAVQKAMHEQLGVKQDGYMFSPAYKSGYWDGIVDFYDKEKNIFPTGLLPQVDSILGELQGKLGTQGYIFQYEIIDDRPDKFLDVSDMEPEIKLDFGDAIYPLRDYQYNSVKSIIENQTGIVNLSTNSGKTAVASGLIKTILPYLESGERIAFFTHSSAIFSQSADNIEQHLGIKVGRYGAGKKDIQQVTFVMIPTINASISADPEAKVKLTAKERLTKRIANEIAPRFIDGFNQRSFLQNYLRNMRVKTKVDQQIKDILEDMLYSCGTDKQLVFKMKNYQAEYKKIIEKKNGKVLKKYSDAMEFLESIAVMIVDEAHHTSSDTWFKTLTACKNAQYRMALTGSIDKDNAVLWQRMQAIFHDVTIKVSNQEMIDRGISAKPTITIFPILAPNNIAEKSYMEAYDSGIASNDYRNLLIAKLAKKQFDRDHGVLVLVNRIEQGESISQFLDTEKVPHYFVSGQLDNEIREDNFQKMREGSLKVLIATTIMDEGVDISGIDTLILGAGGKSLRQTLQRIGRGLRKKKTGENKIEVFDFYDLTNKHLKKHSEERRKIYVSEGFEIVDIPIPTGK